MAVTLPSIGITFKQKSASLITRSERGIAVLIVRDATKTTPTFYSYKTLADVDEDDFSATNLQYIKDVYAIKQPYRVCVVRIAAAGTIAQATAIIESNVTTGWVTIADGTTADFTALVSWIGTCETAKKTYKAIVFGIATAPDKRHVVDFTNTSVVFADSRSTQTGEKYLPSLLGILAAANVESGVTNQVCGNLTSVTAVSAPDTDVAAGKFILVNDIDAVRIGVGVNSLTTTNGTTLTEDMKYIETVEAMDIISDDIRDEFRNNYIGKYKNTYDNQVLFIAAVRGYFNDLATQYILDPDYTNTADVDVSAQRAAWVANGTAGADEWSDAKVKSMAFKRTVYLAADIKILGSMEHLTFAIQMA